MLTDIDCLSVMAWRIEDEPYLPYWTAGKV